MKKGYKFVYSLSHEGNVFYIGCANDVVTRYRQHVGLSSIANGGPIRRYLIKMISQGYYPTVHIIDYLPAPEALKLERTIIKYFALSRHTIFNTFHTLIYQKPQDHNPNNADLKEMLKSIRYKRDWMVRHKGECVIDGIWQPFPPLPNFNK